MHRLRQLSHVQLRDTAAVALRDGLGALARLVQHRLHGLWAAALDQRVEVPGGGFQLFVHGGAHRVEVSQRRGRAHSRFVLHNMYARGSESGMAVSPSMPDAPTPLEEAPPSLADGGPLFLKREDVHELGAFKWRGALPALEGFRARGAEGVVTASTGNHGAASAWAAERLGMRAVVFVPEEASEAKVGLLEQLGAELRRVGADLDESKELAREHAAANELPFFEDGAEPAQFDGYKAIGERDSRSSSDATARVIVPVGNGALIIGVGARGRSGAWSGGEGGARDGAQRRGRASRGVGPLRDLC